MLPNLTSGFNSVIGVLAHNNSVYYMNGWLVKCIHIEQNSLRHIQLENLILAIEKGRNRWHWWKSR
jgi:hypothetical protein